VLRSTVDYYVSFGTTVNICALDLSKAFDKMNHHGLFIKLMDRNIYVNLLSVLENWFSLGVTCVKWGLLCQDLLVYHAGFGRVEYTPAPFFCDLYRQRCKESK